MICLYLHSHYTMSAAALAAGRMSAPSTPVARQPRTDYRVTSAVRKSLSKIQDKAAAVWGEVKRMQRTIDALRAENARLQSMVDESTRMQNVYNDDFNDEPSDKWMERKYKRINDSRFFAARDSSVEQERDE